MTAETTVTTERVKNLSVNNTGVSPQWEKQAGVQTGAPTIPTQGVEIPTDTVNAKLIVKVREDPAKFTSLVTVTDPQDSGTYTVTINGMDFVYTCTGGEDAAAILTGLKGVIDAGNLLTTGNLTYVDADPDTIERGSGSWITDQVGDSGVQKTQLVIVGGINPGTYTVDGAPTSATVVTLIATDELTAGGPEAVTSVTAFQQVETFVETRDDVPTLVIRNNTGVETDEHTTAVSATVGALAFTTDATTTDFRLWGYESTGTPGSEGSSDVVPGWAKINDGEETGLDYRGLQERYDIAGSKRIYCELENEDGQVRVFIGSGGC